MVCLIVHQPLSNGSNSPLGFLHADKAFVHLLHDSFKRRLHINWLEPVLLYRIVIGFIEALARYDELIGRAGNSLSFPLVRHRLVDDFFDNTGVSEGFSVALIIQALQHTHHGDVTGIAYHSLLCQLRMERVASIREHIGQDDIENIGRVGINMNNIIKSVLESGIQTFTFGEADDDEVRVGGEVAGGVFQVNDDGIAGALLETGDHVGDTCHGCEVVDAFDLVDGPVKRGILLAEDTGAVEVGEAGCVFILGSGVYHQGIDGLMIRSGKVDGFLAGLGVGHAGDDGVDLALVQSFDQAVPVHLHDYQLQTELIGDDAGDLNVVAFGIGAGHVLNGDIGLTGFGFLPVVGGIGTFHTDAELAVEVGEGGDVFVGQG